MVDVCKNCHLPEERHEEDGKCMNRCRCRKSMNSVWEPVDIEGYEKIKDNPTLEDIVEYEFERYVYINTVKEINIKPIMGRILGTYPETRKEAKRVRRLLIETLNNYEREGKL